MANRDRKGIAAIDIGSSKIAVLLFSPEVRGISIEGHAVVPSEGVKKGMITDADALSEAITAAVDEAERISGGMITSQAVVGMGGRHLASHKSTGMIPLDKGPRKINQEDLERVRNYSGIMRYPEGSSFLGLITRDIIVDGQRGVDKPVGMSAYRIDVRSTVMSAATAQMDMCDSAVAKIGVPVTGKFANPVCAAEAVLSREEKEWGAAVVDIGSSTTGIALYSDRSLLRMEVLPVGSSNISKDIAETLQIPFKQADALKMKFGAARPALKGADEVIDPVTMAVGADASVGSAVSWGELHRIIDARLYEMLENVASVLEAEGLLGRLPSGIVLTGGGSLMPYLCEYVLENLKVPAKVAKPGGEFGLPERMQYPQMSAAAGLVKICAEMAMPMADVQPGKKEKSQGRGVRALLKGLID